MRTGCNFSTRWTSFTLIPMVFSTKVEDIQNYNAFYTNLLVF